MKLVSWVGDSLKRLREMPGPAKRAIGYELEKIQAGKEPSDWKPMSSIGVGVCEIKVRLNGAFRAIYLARFSEAVYVLHVFQKKSRKTSRADIELARLRYKSTLLRRGRT